MIAPLNSGLDNDKRPWMIADDAFEQLSNAYVFRGRVKKRVGSKLLNEDPNLSRLRINVATTAAVTGNLVATIMPGIYWAIGQQFSVEGTVFTVYQANGATYTTGAATATYNTASGSLVITGNNENPSTVIYFYPNSPVMGLISYETNAVNDEPTYAFDTQFAYQYINGWERLGTAIWAGTDSQFFWGATYRGPLNSDKYLFITNFNAPDPIKYWDSAAWNDFIPLLDAVTTLVTGRIILPFKNRLIVLNTIENDGVADFSYPNRCRFSWNGSPVDVAAWRADIPGKGDWLDAPIVEAIITAEFLRDRLIVYFERSTWELVYTGNEIAPFRWQQINTELGAESTFSIVPFDRHVLGVGDVGIHQCNGINVQRIDNKIPDKVFQFSNIDDGRERIYGIRDYYTELVYWSYPEGEREFGIYPNKILVYNYNNNAWAINDDTITAFGYFQPANSATWENSFETWESSSGTWDGGQLDTKFRSIIAGNQQGYTFILNRDQATNAKALQITNLTYSINVITVTSINHNLSNGLSSINSVNNDYVSFSNVLGITGLEGRIFDVAAIIDANRFAIVYRKDPLDPGSPVNISGTYIGGGILARVTPIDIYTKQYNFYVDKGRNAYVAKVDFLVDKTVSGELTVDSFVSASNESLVNFGITSGALLGTGALETSPYPLVPLEATQARIWHPVYMQSEGECIQLRLYLTPNQAMNTSISSSDFELHAMTFIATATSSRLQ